MRESSWARRLRPAGEDPDPRFSLANERTFLAWIRTALGLMAVGIGVATFVSTQLDAWVATLLAAGLIIVGAAVAATSWFRWLAVERAMRVGVGLPPSRMAPVLAAGIVVLSGVAIVAVVLVR